MSKDTEVASRPGQQPDTGGNSGKSVSSKKKVDTPVSPVEEMEKMRETISQLEKRLEGMAATPTESGEIDLIRSTLKDLAGRMTKMETARTFSKDEPKEYGGPMVKVKVLYPIRLPRNFVLPEGVSRTPAVGTVVELPEELVAEYETVFLGQFSFSGERYKPEDENAPSDVTRHQIKRIARLVEGQPEPDPVPHPEYQGRTSKSA